MKSLNPTPRQIGETQLNEEYKEKVRHLHVKPSLNQYLKDWLGKTKEEYLTEFENKFSKSDYYKKVGNYGNNLKVKQ